MTVIRTGNGSQPPGAPSGDPPPPGAPSGGPQPPWGDPNRHAEFRDWPPLWRLFRRMHPAVLVLFPVWLLLSPLMLLYSLARHARRVAFRIFRDDTDDTPVR